MSHSTDIRPVSAELYFLPVAMRVPLKFGGNVIDHIICARVKVTVESRDGRTASGWGECPLSVSWGWPSPLDYSVREGVYLEFARKLAAAIGQYSEFGHPLEVGYDFQEHQLPQILQAHNAGLPAEEQIPLLAALICLSPIDMALHDAFGNLCGKPIYELYGPEYCNRDLASFLETEPICEQPLTGRYVQDFLLPQASRSLDVWHLVGGLDPLETSDLTGKEPDDGYPRTLREWIDRDGLKCLKIKLCGTDEAWDYQRLVEVGKIAETGDVPWLTTDFNATVQEPDYVNRILDRLMLEHPRIYGMILYVEQPFPYDLEAFGRDVHSVSARKPLFMDESAHDWKHVRTGKRYGWNAVALKTCKTQTGALLSGCWARAHGMPIMVQDLTNPRLAAIPHLQLAANFGTILGVETNAPQFYPEASSLEAEIHPGVYRRRNGKVDLSTLIGPGFGYGEATTVRPLPAPEAL